MIGKYSHLIWDWNGTLFNDVDLCVSVMNSILSKRKMELITKDFYRSIFTFPVSEYYKKIGFDFSNESFEKIGKEWMDEYEKRRLECTLYDGSREILNQINELGIGQSILSAYSQNTLCQLTDIFNITDLFDQIVGLDHIYADSKLHLGRKLLKKISRDEDNIVLIGDTLHDIEVAEALGAECIIISNGHQHPALFEGNNLPILESISEILN